MMPKFLQVLLLALNVSGAYAMPPYWGVLSNLKDLEPYHLDINFQIDSVASTFINEDNIASLIKNRFNAHEIEFIELEQNENAIQNADIIIGVMIRVTDQRKSLSPEMKDSYELDYRWECNKYRIKITIIDYGI